MSGVEYSVSVRAKNGVSDMVSLELRDASTVPAIITSTSVADIAPTSTSVADIAPTSTSGADIAPTSTSGADIAPIVAGVVCSLVVIILLVAGITGVVM